MVKIESPYRAARAEDAPDLARLIDRAGEGIPRYLWGQSARAGQDPFEIGAARAARAESGFSYTNSVVREEGDRVVAMLLGYRLSDPYELGDLSELPGLVVPMVELEARAPGSWYVNALAVERGFEGRGIGGDLMALAEKLALESSAKEISLIVAEQNARAKALYERLGYAERDRRALVPVAGLSLAGDWVLMVKAL